MFIHGYDYVSTFLPPALAMVVVAVAVAAVPRVCRSMWRFRCSFRFVAKSSEANEIHNKRVNDEQGSAAQHTAHSTQHGTARQRMAQHSTAQHSTAQHSVYLPMELAVCLSLTLMCGVPCVAYLWRVVWRICGVWYDQVWLLPPLAHRRMGTGTA